MLAFVMFDAADADNLVAVPVGAETLRVLQRRVKYLAVNVVKLAQAVRHCPRIGKNMTRFAQRSVVGCENRVTDSAARDAVWHRPVFAVPQVVIEAKMVDKPEDLAWMSQHVRRWQECDQSVTGF